MTCDTPLPKETPKLALPASELQTLRCAIAEAAGGEAADEILFRFGQRLGQREAAAAAPGPPDVQAALQRGLTRLAQLGLGHATLDSFQHDASKGECRVAGHVQAPEGPCRQTGETAADGTFCEITVGYVTGFTAAVTGLDVVCSPFHCAGRCGSRGCWFEIRPAHREADSARGSPAPSGSARFFLRTMGKSLADSDISLDELVEHSSDAVILIDSQDVIRFWNRGAERMFGYGRDETVGRRVGFLVPVDLRAADELARIQARIAEEGSVRDYVTRRMRKDGRELWVSLSRAVLHDSQGQVIGSAATLRDITSQRTTEDELDRARGLAMLGEMAAKVAHEIKNPLAGIYAAIQLLGRDLDPLDRRRAVFESVGVEIRRLDETVQDLLRFARPMPARPRFANLQVFLDEMLESLQRHPDLEPHRVATAIEPGLLAGFDARLLAQAFANLVLNAAQAMEHPGTIQVWARRADPFVVIEVGDTGPGVPSAMHTEIFEPFFTTKTRGTGLGLAIARQNVQAHGGRLEVATRPEGGALFRITLPAPAADPSSRG